MKSSLQSRLFLALLAVLLAAPVLILLANHYTDLDLMLADWMFDPVARRFPWKNAWLTDAFGHGILKRVLVVLGLTPILLCAWDLFRPIGRWSDGFRLRMRVLALSAAFVPLLISTLKQISASHCPWDIDRYGGAMPYVRLLEFMPDGLAHGRCFPAGHATSALWMIAIALFWWPHRPRIAVLVGFITLLFGFIVGWMQQMRGAHFLSHTLWSMWLAGVLVVGFYVVLKRWSKRREPSPPSP